MPTAPKVIYIAGSGRSGSTLLSLLLSQHPQIANFGQIRDVFLARSHNAICSCGEGLEACTIWGPVLDQQPKEARRLGLLPQKAIVNAYLSAFANTGATVCVDSSKSVDLCRALQAAPEVDLYCLNLIRDPRAVAVSWSKVLGNSDLLRKRCHNWVGRQKRIEQLGASARAKFLQLRYEDFVRDAVSNVAMIHAWAGVAPDASTFESPGVARVSWQDQHLFAPANEAVLQARATSVRIAEATAWKDPEAAHVRALATEICFPFAKRYGYRLDTSP